MIVYFVRHGESELGVKRIHQDGNAVLSKNGISQAEKLSERCVSLPIDTIISSPFERARKTAEIVSQKIHIPVQVSSSLVEMKRPTEIEGRSVNEPEVVRIKTTMRNNWDDPNYRHSDEETYFEFKARAEKAIGEIELLHSAHALVVTHGDLMRMIICILLFGKEFSPKKFLAMRNFFALSNTGISICEYLDGKWRLISWNDSNHLSA